MHFVTKLAVAAAALAASVSAQLTVASPCQPIQLSWSGSTAGGPYYVALLPGGQASATPLKDLGEIPNSPYSWTVDLAAGTSVTIRVTDASGQPQYSDPITIQDSQSTSCLNGGGASASGSSSATGSAGASASSGGASQSDSGSASPTASGSSSTSSPNAGSSVVVGSLTGLAGLLVAAVGIVA